MQHTSDRAVHAAGGTGSTSTGRWGVWVHQAVQTAAQTGAPGWKQQAPPPASSISSHHHHQPHPVHAPHHPPLTALNSSEATVSSRGYPSSGGSCATPSPTRSQLPFIRPATAAAKGEVALDSSPASTRPWASMAATWSSGRALQQVVGAGRGGKGKGKGTQQGKVQV